MSTTRYRLPTLEEVLNRTTLPPVDLYGFYVFMRDQQRAADYLDFWLDVTQHMSLCRLYVSQLQRSMNSSGADKKGEKGKRVHESLKIQKQAELANGPEGESKRISMILRADSVNSVTPEVAAKRQDALYNLEGQATAIATPQFARTDAEKIEATVVTRKHVWDSTQRILATYLVAGGMCELPLPGTITRAMTNAIEEEGRDDPEVFDEAKEYVFQAMEREAYPAFLAYKALGNLVPAGALTRLFIGLLALFGAFWTAFALIFLDRAKHERLWLILPFSVGVYGCMAFQYYLDPIAVLLGYSELTYGRYHRIREPYVRSLLGRRAVWVFTVTVLVIVCLCVLFCLVPGRRL
ncbi:RGS domain-containing protein [Lipomyces oligophaga]|uniref:RGS domain-containing protein n=1 Tax=Lipomyces oligophaga TaxID=45792 RepID=UPI0034CF36F8